MSIITDITPGDLGLIHYPSFRDIQLEALEFAAESFDQYRFVACALPTGSGKSLFAFALAKMLGLRTVFLTATKGLQEQYSRENAPYGMVDIRGKSNYPCLDYAHLDCHAGSQLGCRYGKGKGCSYEGAKGRARNAQYDVTNYAFWFGVNDKANGIERTEAEAEWAGENPFELLVLDEGHEAPGMLSNYISCKLYESDLRRFSDYPAGEDMREWMEWAKLAAPVLDAEIRTTEMELVHLGRKVQKKHMDVINHLRRLATYIARISFASGDDWIVDREEGTKFGRCWKFDSVFPGKYAESYLFCGIPKVLVMSATLKPKTMGELGVKREKFAYRAWKRIFPANRHKIYFTTCRKPDGTSVRLDRRTSDNDKFNLIAWIDSEIIKPRLDRKGLIQTVSYDLQRYVMDNSRYEKYMIGNTQDADSDTAQEAADRFRKAKPPALLVSPSFATGWDFSGDSCEYIIILKVPFEAQTKIYKARSSRDEMYGDYRAMQKTEQSAGRGMRFELDRCEVFLVDGHFAWFLSKNAHLAQDWFQIGKGIMKVVEVPKPPAKL